MSKERRVLITGAGGPASINLTKSLQIAPEKIFTVGTDANRYNIHLAETGKKYVIPKASNPKDYIDNLNKVIIENDIDFIIPQTDLEVKVVGENRESIKSKTFLPNQKTIETCQDKFLTYCVLKSVGVPLPKTQLLNDIYYPFNLFEAGKNYPFWVRARKGAGGRASTLVNNQDMMKTWICYWLNRGLKLEDFIVQEYLPGRNIAFHSIWKNGQLITSMARERLEYIYPQLSPSGITGTPTVQRTIHDSVVNEISTDAVLAIDKEYTGIACVDLKENEKGVPCITEINAGRMFTTSYFFSYASRKVNRNWHANFPYLYLKLGLNEELPNLKKYDILPQDLYWIRHIDAPAKLVKRLI